MATSYKSSSKTSCKVTFCTVTVHYHDTELGDSPSVTAGAPLSIGWQCVDCETLPVDAFETQRPIKRACARLPRLGAGQRQHILLDAGVPLVDIQQRIQECDALRLELQKSVGVARAKAFGLPFQVEQAQKPKFPKRVWKRLFGRRSI